jgi:hypothetical protein
MPLEIHKWIRLILIFIEEVNDSKKKGQHSVGLPKYYKHSIGQQMS